MDAARVAERGLVGDLSLKDPLCSRLPINKVLKGATVSDRILRDQLIAQLEGGQAYMPVKDVFEGFPVNRAGVRVDGIRHTPWELLEHLRIAQGDILYFTRDPNYVTPPWPAEHWPKTTMPLSAEVWNESVSVFLDELNQVKNMARDPEISLFERIPHGSGQTYLREILLVADHNAYHLGQLLMLRRALDA